MNCPLCGCELERKFGALTCSNCSYIETDDKSYDEICDMFSKIPDKDKDEDIPY